jgi:hypothetical protein
LSRHPRIAIKVDFPEPDGPMSARNSPRSTVRSTPRRARTATPFEPNVFVRLLVSMMGVIARIPEVSGIRVRELRFRILDT